MRTVLATLAASVFSLAAHAAPQKVFCFSMDFDGQQGLAAEARFELENEVPELGKFEDGKGLVMNYRVVTFTGQDGKPALAALFSASKNGKVIMASTQGYSADGESIVLVSAEHPLVQNALATDTKFKSIQSVYDAGLVPADEPNWLHLTCGLVN